MKFQRPISIYSVHFITVWLLKHETRIHQSGGQIGDRGKLSKLNDHLPIRELNYIMTFMTFVL